VLDGVERVGNRVPHPAVIFFILAGLSLMPKSCGTCEGTVPEHPDRAVVDDAAGRTGGWRRGQCDRATPRRFS
jgi:hypothetical protein